MAVLASLDRCAGAEARSSSSRADRSRDATTGMVVSLYALTTIPGSEGSPRGLPAVHVARLDGICFL